MSPDEVLSELKKLGVSITRKTLLNYEEIALPKPQRGSGGRGIGRFTEYQRGTVEYAFAIYHMLNSEGLSSCMVYDIARAYNVFLKDPLSFFEHLPKAKNETSEIIEQYLLKFLINPLCLWITYTLIGSNQIDPQKTYKITMTREKIDANCKMDADEISNVEIKKGTMDFHIVDKSDSNNESKVTGIEVFLSKSFLNKK